MAFIGADYVLSTNGVKGHLCICSLSRLGVHLQPLAFNFIKARLKQCIHCIECLNQQFYNIYSPALFN